MLLITLDSIQIINAYKHQALTVQFRPHKFNNLYEPAMQIIVLPNKSFTYCLYENLSHSWVWNKHLHNTFSYIQLICAGLFLTVSGICSHLRAIHFFFNFNIKLSELVVQLCGFWWLPKIYLSRWRWMRTLMRTLICSFRFVNRRVVGHFMSQGSLSPF